MTERTIPNPFQPLTSTERMRFAGVIGHLNQPGPLERALTDVFTTRTPLLQLEVDLKRMLDKKAKAMGRYEPNDARYDVLRLIGRRMTDMACYLWCSQKADNLANMLGNFDAQARVTAPNQTVSVTRALFYGVPNDEFNKYFLPRGLLCVDNAVIGLIDYAVSLQEAILNLDSDQLPDLRSKYKRKFMNWRRCESSTIQVEYGRDIRGFKKYTISPRGVIYVVSPGIQTEPLYQGEGYKETAVPLPVDMAWLKDLILTLNDHFTERVLGPSSK